MRRCLRGWAWLVVVVAVAAGAPKPPVQVVPPRADEARLAWAPAEPYVAVVPTSSRTLDVYQQGDRIRSYPAVFGLGGSAGKLFEGDRRTPTGLYAIVDSRPHARWRRFLLLDYP